MLQKRLTSFGISIRPDLLKNQKEKKDVLQKVKITILDHCKSIISKIKKNIFGYIKAFY